MICIFIKNNSIWENKNMQKKIANFNVCIWNGITLTIYINFIINNLKSLTINNKQFIKLRNVSCNWLNYSSQNFKSLSIRFFIFFNILYQNFLKLCKLCSLPASSIHPRGIESRWLSNAIIVEVDSCWSSQI